MKFHLVLKIASGVSEQGHEQGHTVCANSCELRPRQYMHSLYRPLLPCSLASMFASRTENPMTSVLEAEQTLTQMRKQLLVCLRACSQAEDLEWACPTWRQTRAWTGYWPDLGGNFMLVCSDKLPWCLTQRLFQTLMFIPGLARCACSHTPDLPLAAVAYTSLPICRLRAFESQT